MIKNISITLLIYTFIFVGCGSDKTGQTAKSEIPTIAKLDEIISGAPDDHSAYYDRAKVYYENEGYQEAIDDLNKAISLDSSIIEYHHLLADSYLDYFQSKNAIETLEKATQLFPDHIHTQLKLSEFYLILKQYEPSIQTAGNILLRDGQNGEAYFMMGLNFRAMKDSVKAISSLQAAVEHDPEIMDAWLLLGEMHEVKNDPLALDFYNGALTVNPNDVNALHAKAFYLQNHDGIEEALTIYKKIMMLDRNNMNAPLNTGILYLEKDSPELAYEHFNILCENVPENPLGYFYRGLSQEALGKIEAAKADYETALRFNPDYEKARNALANLE